MLTVTWNVGKWLIPFYQILQSTMRAITVTKNVVFVMNFEQRASAIDKTVFIAIQDHNRTRATVIEAAVAVVLQVALVVREVGAVSPVVTEAHLAPAEADTDRPTSPTRATLPRMTPRTIPSRLWSRAKIMRIFREDRCRASYS